MPNRPSGLQAVAKLASALYPTRYLDAHALYWAADDQRFAAATLTGQRLWEVEIEDGNKLVGIFDGQPVVLTSRLDPPDESALVFLDPATGGVARRVAAPADSHEAAFCDGVFAFLVASERFGAADTLVLVNAATGRRETIVTGGLASGLCATPAGFIFSLDYVSVAYDPRGRLRWQTPRVIAVSGHVVLATDLGGKLARLRPEDGEPLWSFTMKGAPRKGLVQVHAGADAVAVLEPTLGELALLDRDTGKQRWRTGRVVASQHTPPLITSDAVVALAADAALAAFALADGSARGVLRTRSGFDLTGGLVAGEVCVLAEAGGQALHLVRVPAGAAARPVTTPAPAPAASRSAPRSAEPLPVRLQRRIDALGDAIEITQFTVHPAAPAALLDRAEASIARPLPPVLRALLSQCNGLELHWRARRDRDVRGRVSLLPVERMFGDGQVWGDEAFRDDLWLEDFADDLGEAALAAFKALRPLDRFHDSRPIAWRLQPEGDEQVVQIDRWTIRPLGVDLAGYIDRLVDTLGRDGYVDDATLRPPGDTPSPAAKKTAAKKPAAKQTAATKTAAKKPVATKTAVTKPAVKKPAAKKPAAKKPTAKKTAVTKPTAKKSPATKTAAKKPTAKKTAKKRS